MINNNYLVGNSYIHESDVATSCGWPEEGGEELLSAIVQYIYIAIKIQEEDHDATCNLLVLS